MPNRTCVAVREPRPFPVLTSRRDAPNESELGDGERRNAFSAEPSFAFAYR